MQNLHRSHEAVILLLCFAAEARGQSTQGYISGRAFDQRTGWALEQVEIAYRHEETGEENHTVTGELGYFTLPALSPGTYWLRATKDGVQAQEINGAELFVGGQLQVDFYLRDASDLYSQRVYQEAFLPNTAAIVHTYAADLNKVYPQALSVPRGEAGPKQASMSYVVDPRQIRELPLSGRDTYTMLVTLPGVTADNATARGLGLSVAGQRSTSSNFLLDGLENNDSLLTGPATVLAPEAVQEYRVSTNNYSAEFGRTGGFVVNAITRAGSNLFHGIGYGYLSDTVLNANNYQHKAGLNTSTGIRSDQRVERQKDTQINGGFWAGGRVVKDLVFWSAAFDRFRSRGSADEFPYQVPIVDRLAQIAPQSTALRWLRETPPPLPTELPASGLSATLLARPSLGLDRYLTLARYDRKNASGTQRVSMRVVDSRQQNPYYYYSIYPGLSSELHVNSTGLAGIYTYLPRSSSFSNEARFGWTRSDTGWNRPMAERPALQTNIAGPNQYLYGIALPSSDAAAAYQRRANTSEFGDVVSAFKGRHHFAAGAGILAVQSNSLLNFRENGLYKFESLSDFAHDNPFELDVSIDRQRRPAAFPTAGFNRNLRNQQFHLFAQDSVRIGRRLGIYTGIRYESFGAPKNTGLQDAYFQFQGGATIEERLQNARLVIDNASQRSAYQPDRNNFAGRMGLAWNVPGNAGLVFRAGYGIFFDRPFENLIQTTRNNDFELAVLRTSLTFPRTVLSGQPSRPQSLPHAVWIDDHLRTPYVQSWFGAFEHHASTAFSLELAARGSLGRKLLGADLVNRRSAGSSTDSGGLSASIPRNIYFLSNSASSSYAGISAAAKYRGRLLFFQIAYTIAHSIDNQSDPLQGTFDDLSITRSSNTGSGSNLASYTRQFDSRLDRANSDFDQRHNVVAFATLPIPGPSRSQLQKLTLTGWQVSGIAAIRSGFPYNLIAGFGLPACPGAIPIRQVAELVRNRPSLLPGQSPVLERPEPVPGGFRLLNTAAFCDPGTGVVGNLGRNSLTGPHFWNADVSLAKSIPLRRLGEGVFLQFRADGFNVFNHANLAQPDGLASIYKGSTFGVALLGRQGVQPSFPSATPLDQLARQVQLQLKVVF